MPAGLFRLKTVTSKRDLSSAKIDSFGSLRRHQDDHQHSSWTGTRFLCLRHRLRGVVGEIDHLGWRHPDTANLSQKTDTRTHPVLSPARSAEFVWRGGDGPTQVSTTSNDLRIWSGEYCLSMAVSDRITNKP